MDWFEHLTGFREQDYDHTRSHLQLAGDRLRSIVNGRSVAVGTLETPALGELRAQAAAVAPQLRGQIRVSCLSGDVRALHRAPALAGALFQVAS